MKKCTSCKLVKPLNDFSTNGSKYRKSKCKPCNANKITKVRRIDKRSYLRSKWYGISERCRDNQSLYYGMKYPIKEDFINWAISREDFLKLFSDWEVSGFIKKLSPSVDRIDNDQPYIFDNMAFVTHSWNSAKDKFKTFKLMSPSGEIHSGLGISIFCNSNGLSASSISKVINGSAMQHKGWKKA